MSMKSVNTLLGKEKFLNTENSPKKVNKKKEAAMTEEEKVLNIKKISILLFFHKIGRKSVFSLFKQTNYMFACLMLNFF